MSGRQGLRERVFARAAGICQCDGACLEHEGRCPTEITLETFHESHLRAAVHGGPRHEANLEAWCSRCNLTLASRDARDPRLMPREWQFRELDRVIDAIVRTRAATLSAAPGAGKTIFAGIVFETLRSMGLVERMVVLVPRRGLAKQWANALVSARHIQLKPHHATERPEQDGVVVTYQSLANRDMLEAHMTYAYRTPTLLVLDEPHHLGHDPETGHKAWSRAVAELAGDVETDDIRVAGILNVSGTLWRSQPRERISTVRYTQPDEEGKITSRVDATVTVEELIHAGQLRSVDLYRHNAKVRIADYADLSFVEGNLSDLDERPARAALRELAKIDEWLEAFVASVLDLLEKAHRFLGAYHAKALIVAASQDQAEAFRDEVNRQMRARHQQPLAVLAVSREDDAQEALEHFRAQKRPGVLCTVDMAGEGYDCPEIAVVGYASNKLTSLYVRQVTARAMRVTDRERELGHAMPAMVVLPDSPALVKELVSYMAPYMHEITREDEPTIHREGESEWVSQPALRRFVLTDAETGAETVTVPFADGSHEDMDAAIAAMLQPHLVQANVPEVFHPRIIISGQRTIRDLLQARPFDTVDPSTEPEAAGAVTATATIEEEATMLMTQLNQLDRRWAVLARGDTSLTPIQQYVHMVNDAGGIPNGKRSSASVQQLKRSLEFAKKFHKSGGTGGG
jgi:superfamily II DNA or RNA helicase